MVYNKVLIKNNVSGCTITSVAEKIILPKIRNIKKRLFLANEAKQCGFNKLHFFGFLKAHCIL